jgi:hypothetical protein
MRNLPIFHHLFRVVAGLDIVIGALKDLAGVLGYGKNNN